MALSGESGSPEKPIRCQCLTETYQQHSKCLMLFGIPLFNLTESPWTVLQGNHVMKPGQCWPMSGSQGFLVIALSHLITISHVTLDHLPRYNHPTSKIDSGPKDFLVYDTSVRGGEKIAARNLHL